MKKYLITLFLIPSIYNSHGQNPWIFIYNFSDKIFDKLSRDSINNEAAQELSYIGEYEKMLAISINH